MEPGRDAGHVLSLLVVDDDKMARDVLSVMITRKFPHSSIYFAEDGQSGVEVFMEHRPDIVITDISMPGMDGIQMAGAIKSLQGGAKFIVLTGYADKDYSLEFSKFGINECIMKPIVFGKLFAAIEKCISEMQRNAPDPA